MLPDPEKAPTSVGAHQLSVPGSDPPARRARELDTSSGGRSLSRSPGDSVAGFSRGFRCSSVSMLMPIFAAIDPNDWPGRTVQYSGPSGIDLGAWLGRMQPQIQSLPGHEAERINLRVERLQPSDTHPGLRGNLHERVARANDPVRTGAARGRGRSPGSPRAPAGVIGSAHHHGDRRRRRDRENDGSEIARQPASSTGCWRTLHGHCDPSHGASRMHANYGAPDHRSPAASHPLRRSRT